MSGAGFIAAGAISAAISVAMGAFGAHGLEARLDARALDIWKTAALYQMFHALALVAFGIYRSAHPAAGSLAGWAFLLGTLFFSGSLYALSLSGIRVLGAITPIGGVFFIIGWIAFAATALRSPSS